MDLRDVGVFALMCLVAPLFLVIYAVSVAAVGLAMLAVRLWGWLRA
jgi:hypothetical protein